jgi:copper resistance protein B
MRYGLLLVIGLSLPPTVSANDAHGAGVPMAGMHEGDPMLFMLKADELEARDTDAGAGVAWDGEAWLGRDLDKGWVKFEGERDDGSLHAMEIQFLYSRAVTAYWDVQAGWRHDFRPDPDRDWLAVGFKGLAPYWFEVDAAAFFGESGRLGFRLEAEYELLITQRLILSPEVEFDWYGEDDSRRGLGSGPAEFEAGLRLRYEIRREIAPYIGLNWTRLFGDTADLARGEGQAVSDLQALLGIRFWF